MVFSTWFFPDSVKKNKARCTKHTWSINLSFLSTDSTEIFNRKKVLSQNLRIFALEITCIIFIAPFRRLVSVMMSITLRNSGMQATWRQKFQDSSYCRMKQAKIVRKTGLLTELWGYQNSFWGLNQALDTVRCKDLLHGHSNFGLDWNIDKRTKISSLPS